MPFLPVLPHGASWRKRVIYQSQEKSEEAIFEYQGAIALEPAYGWAWSNLGNARLSLHFWT